MKYLRQSIKMLRFNFSSIFLFEIFYRVLSWALMVPVLYGLLNLSMEYAHVPYLSAGTINKYFSSPVTYIFLFIIFFLLAVFLLIDLSGLIYSMEASVRLEKVSALEILIYGVKHAIRGLNPKNFGCIAYVFFVLPFTYTLMLSGSLLGMKLPQFFQKFFTQYRFGLLIALSFYLVMCVTFVRKLFMLNYFVIYDVDYKQASRMSQETLKKHWVGFLVGVITLNLSLTALLVLVQGSVSTGITVLISQFVKNSVASNILDIVVRIVVVLGFIIMATIATPLIHAYICAHFYEREGDLEYKEFKKLRMKVLADRELPESLEHAKKRQKGWWISAVVLGTLLNLGYLYLSLNDYANLRIVYPRRSTVTAHRGASEYAPENTMIAIQKAQEANADIIEIDVRQTKDGEYVIMHDESLQRTANVKRKVGEVDSSYIRQLDVGSYFDRSFDGTPVPTLREVIAYAKEHEIYLNIELKPAKTDQNYLQGILEMIDEYDYVKHCMLASQNYQLLKRAKEQNPQIKTVYIMTMAFGQFGDMEGIDAFSIKHTYISHNMVSDIHKHGKEVYAWTVRTEEDTKKLLLLDVDSIITDDPEMIRKYIVTANSSLIQDLLNRIISSY